LNGRQIDSTLHVLRKNDPNMVRNLPTLAFLKDGQQDQVNDDVGFDTRPAEPASKQWYV